MKTGEPAIGLQECFLGEIVGQCVIATGQMTEEIAHGGLMVADQRTECSVIVGDKHAGD